MTTTRDLIEEKLLVCDQIRKRKDLLTDEEYQILKECRTTELFRVESNTQRLGKICEGEKRQLAAFYDEQDAKYRRAVTKINRRVLPKPRDAVPPPRPIVRPTETSPPVSTTQDTTVIRLTGATRSTGMGMDAAIDTRAAVSPVTPAPDIYQLEEQIPVSVIRSEHELMLEALEDDNFGNAQGDGMRDFLEMCTGTELPPMELGDESSQKLLLSQLPSMQHPTLPVVDNFQELNIDAVLSQLDLPGPTGPPNAPTPPQLIPPLPFEAFGEDGLDNAQQLPPAFESVPVVQSPLLEAPSERSQYVPAEAPVLPEPVEEAVPPRPARGVRRQPRTFTNRLPLLEDLFGLPRNRNTFDIFSCYYDSNIDWMIERLQNQLFEQRVASPLQPQPLLTTDLSAIRPNDSMSIDAQRRITGSGVAGNVSEWSRENPPPLSFADRTDPHGQSSNLHDAARARMTDALETPPVGVASIVAPESLPPLLSLPPLHDDLLPAQPHVVEQPIFPAAADEEITPRTHVLTRTIEEPRLEKVAPSQLPAKNVPTCKKQEPLDYMLVGILLVLQSEMSKLRSITHEVPVHQLKKVFGINTRGGEVKLFKNILLLKHARLVETCLYENQSIKSIYIIFPVSAAN